jgi:hypothetical protein
MAVSMKKRCSPETPRIGDERNVGMNKDRVRRDEEMVIATRSFNHEEVGPSRPTSDMRDETEWCDGSGRAVDGWCELA